MRKFTTRDLTLAAVVAALYTALSYFGNIFGLTYGPIQCRFSEALCVLPFLFPATVPGLFVGCLLTNLMSTVGPLDLVLGSLATLLWYDRLRALGLRVKWGRFMLAGLVAGVGTVGAATAALALLH